MTKTTINVKETADRLSLTIGFVYTLIRNGKLEAEKDEKEEWRVCARSVRKWDAARKGRGRRTG